MTIMQPHEFSSFSSNDRLKATYSRIPEMSMNDPHDMMGPMGPMGPMGSRRHEERRRRMMDRPDHERRERMMERQEHVKFFWHIWSSY